MDNSKNEIKNRIEEVERLMNSYVRTERHLEQYSDIASKEQINHVKDIQSERVQRMEDLENKIVYGDGYNNNEERNLEAKIKKTKNYTNYNGDHMSTSALNNIREKQENRKEQLNSLQ